MPQARVVGVDGAKHLWVGEKYAGRVLNEIVDEVLPGGRTGRAGLPQEWDGPVPRPTPEAARLPQWLSWRTMKISFTSSMIAAAVGMAIRAPSTPSRLPPAITEMTATAPGTATAFCMTRGEMK